MNEHAWRIRVQGYGTFDFYGTEAEAEEMRAHKAQWEKGVGLKWRADLARPIDSLTAEIASEFDKGKGVRRDKLILMKSLAAKETS